MVQAPAPLRPETLEEECQRRDAMFTFKRQPAFASDEFSNEPMEPAFLEEDRAIVRAGWRRRVTYIPDSSDRMMRPQCPHCHGSGYLTREA